MSHNPSNRSEYRKTGRSGSSGQQRQFQGSGATKGGGGAPPATVGNRSFKKYNNNVQGGQPGARNPGNVETGDLTTANAVPNGAHQQIPQTQRISDAPVPIASTSVNPWVEKVTQVPKVPSSNASSGAPPANVSTSATTSEANIPKTPAKAPEDASKSFTLQFGSMSPCLMNGMQIPARTSSAPPNLDEQKKAQAQLSSMKAAPPIPTPSIPKQQLSRKDAVTYDHSNTGIGVSEHTSAGEAQPLSKPKRDVQVSSSASPPVTHAQKPPSLHPIQGMPMPFQFHQPQVPVQYGGPSPQLQSQPLPGTSLPMPMPMSLPLGNPPVPHSMFVPALQPHLMQSQGMMHQGQAINFSSQMGPQIHHQMGNMGMNMPPQFPQQSPLKIFGSARRAVKITHPETHEELRLDSSPPIPKPHANVPPQSQPGPPNIPLNFYPNTYNGAPVFLHPANSVPLNTAQVPPSSQPPRSHNQVTIRAPIISHGEKDIGSSTSVSVGKTELSKSNDLGQLQKEVGSSIMSSVPESKSRLAASSVSAGSSGPINVEKKLTSASAPVNKSESSATNSSEDPSIGTLVTEPVMDKQKKLENIALQDQGARLGDEISDPKSLPSRTNALSETDELPLAGRAASSKACNLTGMVSEEIKTNGEPVVLESSEPDIHSITSSMRSASLESAETTGKMENSHQDLPSSGSGLAEHSQVQSNESSDVKVNDDSVVSEHISMGGNTGSSGSVSVLLPQGDKFSTSGALPSVSDTVGEKEKTFVEQSAGYQDSAPVLSRSLSTDDSSHKHEESEISKDRVSSVANVAKTAAPRVKKKKKDLYRKAEAAGTSSDLYMAYKGPDDKKHIVVQSVDGPEKSLTISVKQNPDSETQDDAVEKPAHVKLELDDWEDAAEISTPHLEASKNTNQDACEDKNGSTTKSYSRDFLLKFKDQCTDLPLGFEISADLADALMTSSVNVSPHPSPGRHNVGPRLDSRSSGLGDEDKWNRFPGPLMMGRGDMRGDFGAGNIVGFRPGQGGHYGAMRNPRAQAPFAYGGGILSGPMQSPGPQGGLMRNNSDSDRWQRGSGYMKGLMPSPQTPTPLMHRAEKKYEVGKVTDEEEAKQRQLKAILNKLTPQNFEKLFQQVKQVNIDNVVTLSGVISQIFDKALMEPTFCEMYANFCFHLAADLPDLSVDNEKITFKRLLVNKCQEEFERGEREEEEANKTEEEGENKQSAEEREEKRLKARRRMLGNIRLIGELYKKRMLTERIMHECMYKLLYQNLDEENIEALCKLMSTIGEMIDHPKAKEHIDAYFDMMAQLSNNMKFSSRVRFMLKDSIDLRKNKWQQRRKIEGPKKIEEVHRDAAQERHAQTSRLARVPSMGGSSRRGQPIDLGSRSPSMLSPTPQIGGFRPAPPQLRGYGSQDVRTMDDRHSFDNRTMSVPLQPQRSLGENNITLGPQGGLARGMAFRGQQSSAHSVPMAEMQDARRMVPGHNGLSSVPDRAAYGQREEQVPRYMSDRFGAPHYEQLNTDELNVSHGNRDARNVDRGYDRYMSSSPSAQSGSAPQTSAQNVTSEKMWSEEVLRDKSVSAIKEFYSARDEDELVLCIKELNAPSFYPTMVSTWITDSFERKDMERDLLTKLLINLTRPDSGILSEEQLLKGFEFVLVILEDAVNDAPKAADFLGRIFAKVIMENVTSLSEIGRLVYEGGEEPGRLVEIGLGSEVLGSIFDIIEAEKGDSVLSEIHSSSKLRLENFRPPGSSKTLRIDRFI